MTAATQTTTEVKVPDIGDFSDVPVIEVLVKPGDVVNADDPLVTLESDKATMDVPSPAGGAVADVLVKVGDTVSEGTLILMLQPGNGALTEPPSLVEQQEPPPEAAPAPTPVAAAPAPTAPTAPAAPPAPAVPAAAAPDVAGVHAGPSVRRMAREFDIDLGAVTGTGPKGRITKEDLLGFLRGPAEAPAPAAAPAGMGIPEIPAQDFSKFGPVETKALARIKRISGLFLHRSWLNVPHVTHNDEADITDLDKYRKELDTAAKADGYRVTLLAFLVKACVSVLKQFPDFNSSSHRRRTA